MKPSTHVALLALADSIQDNMTNGNLSNVRAMVRKLTGPGGRLVVAWVTEWCIVNEENRGTWFRILESEAGI